MSIQFNPGVKILPMTIITPATNGCGRITAPSASFGYPMESHPTLDGTRAHVVAPRGRSAVLARGAGLVSNDPIQWEGDGTQALIEVEGRDGPASGRHRFRDQMFFNAATAFRVLRTPAEEHGDNCIVDCCEFGKIRTVFESLNQQAVGWKFRDCVVNKLDDSACIFADLQRGGNVTISGLYVNHPKLTLFQLGAFSPNTARLIAHDVIVDRMNFDKLCAVRYAGGETNPTYRWSFDIDIFICCSGLGNQAGDSYKIDPAQLIDAPASLPRDDWSIRIHTCDGVINL